MSPRSAGWALSQPLDILDRRDALVSIKLPPSARRSWTRSLLRSLLTEFTERNIDKHREPSGTDDSPRSGSKAFMRSGSHAPLSLTRQGPRLLSIGTARPSAQLASLSPDAEILLLNCYTIKSTQHPKCRPVSTWHDPHHQLPRLRPKLLI